MAKLRTYSMNLDGTHNVLVAAPSQKAAAELIGVTVYMLRTWDAGHNEADEALALSEPGQVFRQKGVNGSWERWPLTPVANSPTDLEDQRKAVMARHKELVAKRDAINREIDENFKFFAGKAVRVKHSRGEFEAEVIRVYSDGTMAVKNLDTGKNSTRLLYELAGMIEEEQV